MKEKIQQLCKELEKKHAIRILFAVENGSRAWRMESADSDYDVRFVFVRPLKEYLSLEKKDDVINASYDEGMIDMSGFDIYKFAYLLASSNPTTIEWLISDIVYYGKQNTVFKGVAEHSFDPVALFHHYASMCKNNYLKYLKSGNLVTYKKYLYAYRGLINATWVKEKGTIPPIRFTKTIQDLQGLLPKTIISRLQAMIERKKKGEEKDLVGNIPHLDKYIEQFLQKSPPKATTKKADRLQRLENEVLDIVMQDIISVS
jgi:hypothetical protein